MGCVTSVSKWTGQIIPIVSNGFKWFTGSEAVLILHESNNKLSYSKKDSEWSSGYLKNYTSK